MSETGFCDVGIPTTYIVTDPAVSNFNWVVGVPPLGEMPGPARQSVTVSPSGKKVVQPECGSVVDALTVHASRPATTKLLVLCLVLVPLLLLALLGIRLAEGAPRSIDGLVGVTAIMLAILPIRSVLVPADISSLTIVDFALASEMTLLAVGTVAWFLWPGRGGRSG